MPFVNLLHWTTAEDFFIYGFVFLSVLPVVPTVASFILLIMAQVFSPSTLGP
jgi:hypothetical protein